jgi:hypothetical protein
MQDEPRAEHGGLKQPKSFFDNFPAGILDRYAISDNTSSGAALTGPFLHKN